jgi:hypothetical protein
MNSSIGIEQVALCLTRFCEYMLIHVCDYQLLTHLETMQLCSYCNTRILDIPVSLKKGTSRCNAFKGTNYQNLCYVTYFRIKVQCVIISNVCSPLMATELQDIFLKHTKNLYCAEEE